MNNSEVTYETSWKAQKSWNQKIKVGVEGGGEDDGKDGGNDGGEVGSFLHLTKMHLKPFLDTFIIFPCDPLTPPSSTIELKLKVFLFF